MTSSQYRCLIAHMMFWRRGLAQAMEDVGISLKRTDVINELFKAGWDYDERTDTLMYTAGELP